MKEIPLTQGKSTIVDDEDYGRVNQYKWYAQKDKNTYYVMSNIKSKRQSLHRFILNIINSDIKVDHIDGNPLNNQKNNLRIVTISQNNMNSRTRKDNSVGCRGVYFDKKSKKFRVRISINKKRFNLGEFKTLTEASEVYNKKAQELFGVFYKEIK